MVNAWNVSELGAMTLPPCHYGFQIYTTELTEMGRIQEYCIKLNKDYSLPSSRDVKSAELDKANIPKRKISLMWNQRSVDVLLGLPFNIASYALLLKLIAKEVNMIPDQLIGNLGDTHLYLNWLEVSLITTIGVLRRTITTMRGNRTSIMATRTTTIRTTQTMYVRFGVLNKTGST